MVAAYFAPHGSISQERFETWSTFDETVVDSFAHYEVPTIELARSTAKEAVCRVKSTGRTNLYTRKQDLAIEWVVVKSIAAFMNTEGGYLLIGVADDGTPTGIEADYDFVKH